MEIDGNKGGCMRNSTRATNIRILDWTRIRITSYTSFPAPVSTHILNNPNKLPFLRGPRSSGNGKDNGSL